LVSLKDIDRVSRIQSKSRLFLPPKVTVEVFFLKASKLKGIETRLIELKNCWTRTLKECMEA